jgi:glucosamine--fructose-6-phosphate aminotransferase (isomerizing)
MGLGYLAYGFIGLGKFVEIFIPWELVSQYIPFEIPLAYVPHFYGIIFTCFAVLEEIRARRGPVIAVTHAGDERLVAKVDDVLVVPPTLESLNPILLTIPLQLFAYHCALALDRDVDQPRNLAKSVTVE